MGKIKFIDNTKFFKDNPPPTNRIKLLIEKLTKLHNDYAIVKSKAH